MEVPTSALKVALLTNFVPPYRIPLFKELHRHFPNLDILVSTKRLPNPNWPDASSELPIAVQKGLSVNTRWRHPSGFADTREILVPVDTLPRLLRLKPDVVVSSEMGIRTLQASVFRRLRRKTRLIVWGTLSEVTELDIGRTRQRLRRIILPAADGVITNGESGARYFRSLGVADGDISRIPYANDVSAFQGPSARPPEVASKLLYLGQLITRKGLAPFLGALVRWAEANPGRPVDLLIVGDGPEKAAIQDLCAKMPASVAVEFRPYVAYDAVPDLYRSCGILLFPTLADEWGLVVNEAMSAGLPVLGSVSSQSVEELITDNATGWVFQPGDRASMLDAIDRALGATPDTLDRMRAAAKRKIADVTPQETAKRFQSAILRAWNSRRR